MKLEVHASFERGGKGRRTNVSKREVFGFSKDDFGCVSAQGDTTDTRSVIV